MKEHGILFSAPMVKALLAGRKTVTRRMSKRWLRVKAGDTLWVRETWGLESNSASTLNGHCNSYYTVQYRAGGQRGITFSGPVGHDPYVKMYDSQRGSYRPSIHMPRWASRITLIATEEAREERLQDITEADAIAEGVDPWEFGPEQTITTGERGADSPYRGGFACLWDDLNDHRATWKSNPPVVRLAFRVAA